jgi:hypothetical protein
MEQPYDKAFHPSKEAYLHSIKVATRVTASLTSLHDQSFCTRAHHTVQIRLNKRQVVLGICRARTTMLTLWLLVSLCARENRERRNVTCGVKTDYEKENLFPHKLTDLKIYPRDWHNYLRINEETYLILLSLLTPSIKK